MLTKKSEGANVIRNNVVNTIALLTSPMSISQVAKILKISRIAVWKSAQRYERKGLIGRTCSRPLTFKRLVPLVNPDMPSARKVNNTATNLPLIPHRFGVSYWVSKHLNVPYDKTGHYTMKHPSYTIRFSRRQDKAIIWLKVFSGNSVAEIKSNAFKHVERIAQAHENQYGVKLTFDRVIGNFEWVLDDEPASKEMSERCEIKKGASAVIAGARFKFDDSTHPKIIEINQAKGYSSEIPTQHAQTLETLLSNPETVDYLIKHSLPLLKQFVEAHQSSTETMKEMTNAIISLKMGQEEIIKEVRELKRK